MLEDAAGGGDTWIGMVVGGDPQQNQSLACYAEHVLGWARAAIPGTRSEILRLGSWGAEVVDELAVDGGSLLIGFRDEDVEYALRLPRAGVPTELHVYPGAPHGYTQLGANDWRVAVQGTWTIDGIPYFTANANDPFLQGKQWVFNHPFFILLNMAVGGNFGGSVGEDTVFPATMSWSRSVYSFTVRRMVSKSAARRPISSSAGSSCRRDAASGVHVLTVERFRPHVARIRDVEDDRGAFRQLARQPHDQPDCEQ